MKKLYNRMAAMGQVDEMDGSVDRVREIAEKLNESRRTFISLWGLEHLKKEVEWYRPLLDALCRKHNVMVLQAMNMILGDEKITKAQAMVITAVITEIIDPTPVSDTENN